MPSFFTGTTGIMILLGILVLVLIIILKRKATDAAVPVAATSLPEKNVIATALATELSDIRLKCEMFITIYTEQLRDMRNTEHRASAGKSGDFIHQHPPLVRDEFDTYKTGLSVLGPRLAADIARIYDNISPEPAYLKIDANTSQGEAAQAIENVIENAERILAPIDSIIAGLNVIIRDAEKKRP